MEFRSEKDMGTETYFFVENAYALKTASFVEQFFNYVRKTLFLFPYRRKCQYGKKCPIVQKFLQNHRRPNIAECAKIVVFFWDFYLKFLCMRHEWRHFQDWISWINSYQLLFYWVLISLHFGDSRHSNLLWNSL